MHLKVVVKYPAIRNDLTSLTAPTKDPLLMSRHSRVCRLRSIRCGKERHW